MTPFNELFSETCAAARMANAVRAARIANADRRIRSAADDVNATADLLPNSSTIEPGMLAARVSTGRSLVRTPMKYAASA